MNKGLNQHSEHYFEKNEIYNIFSNAEDYPNEITKFLIPLVKGKKNLDIGCGNGKYLKLLSPFAKHITGVDQSLFQLNKAKEKTKNLKNIKFINIDAKKINFKKNSFDLAIACWVLGTINNANERKIIINKVMESLKPTGSFFLIENDINSEFEEIRERVNDPKNQTLKYNEWLIKEMDFKIEKKINTYFKFKNKNEAMNTIGNIWGEKAMAKVNEKVIKHRVLILKK
jgi:ubiquinone/menaquinone biosynthesis C-methylase UbiE